MTKARGGNGGKTVSWSPAAIQAIGDLWKVGRSASEVAKALTGRLDGGRDLTREGVLGVVHRQGWTRKALAGRTDLPVRVRAIAAPRAPKPKAAKPAKPKIAKAPKPVAPPPPPPPPEVKIRRTIFDPVVYQGSRDVGLDARGKGCSYMTGADVYCGRAVDETTRHKSYCVEHHRIVYMPGSGMKPATAKRLGRWEAR